MNALAFASQVLGLLPLVTQGISGAAGAMQWGRRLVSEMAAQDRDPTDAEWAELNQRTAELRDRLHTD